MGWEWDRSGLGDRELLRGESVCRKGAAGWALKQGKYEERKERVGEVEGEEIEREEKRGKVGGVCSGSGWWKVDTTEGGREYQSGKGGKG